MTRTTQPDQNATTADMHADCAQDCLETALASAEAYCQENRLRFTPLRRKVLELMWQNHAPMKAYDLLELLEASDTNASNKPPTVYRALDFLLENGLVHKLNSLNAFIGCGHPNKHSDCYFLICTECRAVTECCQSSIKNQLDQSMQTHDFVGKSTTLEIHGICKNCQHPS